MAALDIIPLKGTPLSPKNLPPDITASPRIGASLAATVELRGGKIRDTVQILLGGFLESNTEEIFDVLFYPAFIGYYY